MKLFIWIVIFTFTIAAIFTCNRKSEQDDSKKKGGTINIAIQGSANNLFPFNLREYYSQQISSNLLMQFLTRNNSDGDVFPELASSWQVGEYSITYKLKENIKWSNGQSISATDVKTTFNFIQKNYTVVSTSYNIDKVKNVKIIDSVTVRFEFLNLITNPHSYARFPVLNSQQIINADSWDKLKRSYLMEFVGCGPFVLKKYSQNKIQLEQNKFYHSNAPYLDAININFYSDIDSLQNWLDTENIDLVPDLPHNLLKFVRNHGGYEIITSVEPGYTFIGWNLKNKKISNLSIRKGLSHALDRQTMVDGIMSGYATVYDSPAYPEFWAYYKVAPLEYSLEKARTLLKQNGWITNKTTRKLEKNGKIVSLKILTNKENDLKVKIAMNIKAYWEAIGANVEVESVAWGDFLGTLKSKQFDAAIISWAASEIFDPSELYHSSGIASDNNFMAFSSDSVDFYIENALALKQKSKRKENWILFQKKIIDEMPVTVLFGKRQLNVISQNLKNVEINSDGFLYNAKEFWLDVRK